MIMKQYIPVTAEAQETVERELKKTGLFSDLDQFINLYNSKIINVRSEKIKELSELIDESYLNIMLQRNYFFVQSKEEVELKKTLFLLEAWELTSTLKRIANDLINDDLSMDTMIVFDDEKKGVVFYQTIDEDTGDYDEAIEYENAEKLKADKIILTSNPILQQIMNVDEDDENIISFELEDLLSLDDDFLSEISSVVDTFYPSV